MNNLLLTKIRKAVLNGEGSEIRNLLLNRKQIFLLELIKENGMTSAFLSHIEEVSIQNASSKLNRLFTAGYLKRTIDSADTGGIEYLYEVIQD